MSLALLDIDHLIVRVAHLDRGVELYRALGFTVAPERVKTGSAAPAPEAHGTIPRKAPFKSRHVLFRPYPGREDIANFVVLQCIEDQLSVPVEIAQVMGFMLDSEGPRALICYSEDLDETRRAMTEAGIETAPPRWTVEDAWLDGDQVLPVRSQPLITQTRRTPFIVNAFQTETLETLRHEPWTTHANSARYMAGLTGVTDDIQTDVRIMADTVFGVEPEWAGDDVAIIRPRDLFLRIVTPRGFATIYPSLDFSSERVLPALCGVTFGVDSLDAARAALADRSIPFVDTPTPGVVVPRQQAGNTIIEFVEHS